MQRVLAGQIRKQVPELPTRRPQKTTVARHPHQHLRDTERDNLRVAQPPSSIAISLGQQVVSRAVHTDTQQVEVGAHRWLLSDGDKTPPTSTCTSWSLATAKA